VGQIGTEKKQKREIHSQTVGSAVENPENPDFARNEWYCCAWLKQASVLGEYMNALHLYQAEGDASQLKTFQGKQIKDANGVDFSLLTDLPLLNRLGSAGALSFESLYARSAWNVHSHNQTLSENFSGKRRQREGQERIHAA
jgi:hypothetical protein